MGSKTAKLAQTSDKNLHTQNVLHFFVDYLCVLYESKNIFVRMFHPCIRVNFTSFLGKPEIYVHRVIIAHFYGIFICTVFPHNDVVLKFFMNHGEIVIAKCVSIVRWE